MYSCLSPRFVSPIILHHHTLRPVTPVTARDAVQVYAARDVGAVPHGQMTSCQSPMTVNFRRTVKTITGRGTLGRTLQDMPFQVLKYAGSAPQPMIGTR